MLGGHALGVLRHLGERHVGVGHHQAGGGQVGLEALEPPQVGAEGHEPQVGLVAEDGEGDHLVVVGLGRLHRRHHRLPVDPARRRLAEQVEHAPPGGGDDRRGARVEVSVQSQVPILDATKGPGGPAPSSSVLGSEPSGDLEVVHARRGRRGGLRGPGWACRR